MARKRKHLTGRSTLSLLPARIRLATNGVIPDEPPPAGVPVQGVPLGIFKELSRKGRSAPGVEVLIDPIFEADKWNEIRLFINGVQSGVPQNDLDRTIIFNVFQTEFRDNITNVIKYVIRNVAGNENESTELWALYSANRPGGNIPGTGPHPGLIISLPEELGDPPLIDKESANAGVYATQTYSHMKAHDKITLEMGNERFDFKVKPGEVGQSVKTLIERHMFDLVGSQKNCSFRYTVTDQLLNTTDARRWSDYIYANIDLERVALTEPILREDRSDTGDDPKTVDLAKLAAGPLLVIIVPKDTIYQKDDYIRVVFRSSHMDREFEYFGTITVDDFGLLQPCIVEVPNSNIVLDSDLTVTFELHRPQGTVIGYSRSATAKVIGVAVPDLEAPSIKEADGNSLDPLKAKDALTAVIPAYDNMVGTYLEVSWIGTAGGGSHTTTPVLVTAQGDQEVALPNTVVALNLNKPVNVIYKVIRNGSPKDSKPLVLAVQPIADGDPAMGRPLIVEAANGGDGSEFDVNQLTKDATIRVNIWPLIALAQYVWLRVFGTYSNGDEYTQTFWQPLSGQTNQTWINQGYYPQSITLATLKNLKDGSELVVEFKVGLGGSQVETEAVTLQGRRYTVKALVELRPVITSAKGSPSGADIPEGGATIEPSVVLGGTASQYQQIRLYDGLIAVEAAVDVDANGDWNRQLDGLSPTPHRFTAKALYGTGQVSEPRTLTVNAPLVIEPSVMVLDGFALQPPAGLTVRPGYDFPGNTAVRLPSGGIAPFSYTSSQTNIATVDLNGKVAGISNGQTTIVVTDATQSRASYRVQVSNVFRFVRETSHIPSNQLTSVWWQSRGWGTLTSDMVEKMNMKYNNLSDFFALVYWPDGISRHITGAAIGPIVVANPLYNSIIPLVTTNGGNFHVREYGAYNYTPAGGGPGYFRMIAWGLVAT
ncbi:Ig-like domain-containing protein [Pseudomonas sp. Marseille-Q5117]|uniref:Ig-like domain-containing protein n=1 Tax=Pseudomonas sp. Marseille-Q5117 TaxID=2972777 RepID=UPI0021C6AA68|nr:Ig-like domain-containing protein [Pseudomonas sp. Marseille-Q5117]